jgi:hypothetical protein
MNHAGATTSGDPGLQDLETMFLEGKLHAADRRLAQAVDRNQALMNSLSEARDQIASLRGP